MTLQQIHYILTIARQGSLNKAADELYLSQPALTSAIKELENELGFQIFLRSNRGVVLTNAGSDFLVYAKQLYQQFEMIQDKFITQKKRRITFGVSTQHYSFAVSAFVSTIRSFGTEDYEFVIRETRTRLVISDTATLKSEIGILYLSSYNRKMIEKLLRESGLEFHHLIHCKPYVYLWRQHPLAGRASVSLRDLEPYPCLRFEQGENGSAYYSEEILSENAYKQIIKANDRATMLNLMIGVLGYTICCGIICEELNGIAYTAVPFEADSESNDFIMEIGYITKERTVLSEVGENYVRNLKRYLAENRLTD
ncbi:MAG: LysR family transcriptional regulator [Oscillospiraceae bacterium]|nr:LysR family transcriptional regulator [Oscillospiraceae bacterium]